MRRENYTGSNKNKWRRNGDGKEQHELHKVNFKWISEIVQDSSILELYIIYLIVTSNLSCTHSIRTWLYSITFIVLYFIEMFVISLGTHSCYMWSGEFYPFLEQITSEFKAGIKCHENF